MFRSQNLRRKTSQQVSKMSISTNQSTKMVSPMGTFFVLNAVWTILLSILFVTNASSTRTTLALSSEAGSSIHHFGIARVLKRKIGGGSRRRSNQQQQQPGDCLQPDIGKNSVDNNIHSTKNVARYKKAPVRRGGSAAAATAMVVKTMTSRQMEAFNLFAGGIAGTVASCVTNPLEVVKTQLQSSIVSVSAGGSLVGARGHPMTIAKSILERDGPAGFFRGLPPTLIGIIPSRSAYFYAYQRCKRAIGNNIQQLPEGSPINALVSGLMAGIVSNSITNPIWMVKTRMTILADTAAGQQNYRGYRDVVWSIYKQEGIKGFYKGIQASYWGCAEGAIQFLIYEQLKTRLKKRKTNQLIAQGINPDSAATELSLSTYFWSAAVSKMLASICTYPHEVARTRIREQARLGIFKYNNMWQTIGLIAKEEGRQGLYSGMGIHLLKVVPNSALLFLTYEIVHGWLSEFTVVDDLDANKRKKQ